VVAFTPFETDEESLGRPGEITVRSLGGEDATPALEVVETGAIKSLVVCMSFAVLCNTVVGICSSSDDRLNGAAVRVEDGMELSISCVCVNTTVEVTVMDVSLSMGVSPVGVNMGREEGI